MRGWLTGIWEAAKVSNTGLLAAIVAELASQVEATKDGQIPSSIESDNVRIAFSKPGVGSQTPGEMVESVDLVIDYYNRAKVILGGTPTDQQIHDKMREIMRAPRSVRADFSTLQV